MPTAEPSGTPPTPETPPNGAPPTPSPDNGGGRADARIRELTAELKAARAQIEAFGESERELAKLREARDGWKAERTTLTERVALARAGVADDEHETALRAAFGALPAEGRPASLADYWRDLAGKPADDVPRLLRGFLPAPAAAPTGTPPAPGAPPPPRGAAAPGASPEAALLAATQRAREALANDRTNPALHKALADASAALNEYRRAASALANGPRG